MLSENKNNGEKFDKFLKDSLKQYHLPVPNNFPQRILGRFQELERQNALKKIIWQERLLKAACVLLPAAGLILILMFPDILQSPVKLYDTISFVVQETMNNMIQYWQLWTIYAAIAAFVLYAAYEAILADN